MRDETKELLVGHAAQLEARADGLDCQVLAAEEDAARARSQSVENRLAAADLRALVDHEDQAKASG